MARVTRNYDTPTETATSFVWPANLKGSFDYLHIEIVDYIPLSKSISSSQNPATGSNAAPAIPGFGGSSPLNSSNNFSNSQLRVSTQKHADIYLPIPEQLNYIDSLEWADTPVGVGGKALPSIVKNLATGENEMAANDIAKLAAGGKIGMIASIVNGMNFNFNALTQGINGKVLNPYREQIFEGLGMRQFEWEWRLIPRNKTEQLSLDKMIRKIRELALPNYSGQLTADSRPPESIDQDFLDDRWLDVPKIFRLNWKTSNDALMKSLPKIKPCVCMQVQVRFDPNNTWATHMIGEDPYPVGYDLRLTFQETEIITGNDVKDRGY